MFDAIMRDTMPVWSAFSILYVIFVAAFVARGMTRMRRVRSLREQAARAVSASEVRDWAAAPAERT